MTQTTIPASQVTDTQRLASAIMHLANGMGRLGGIAGAAAYTDAARFLVRDLACPPSPAPAPSCYAPHCACVDGTDCPTVGAADANAISQAIDHVLARNPRRVTEAKTKFRFSNWLVGRVMRELNGEADREHVFLAMKEKLEAAETVQPGGPDWHLREAIAHRHLLADVAAAVTVQGDRAREILDGLVARNAKLDANNAKLDGLCKAVDALAERLDRKAGDGSRAHPFRVKVTRRANGEAGLRVWTALVSLREVGPACFVQDQGGAIAYVSSMVVDMDGTSRLFVDLVDGEG